jgi:folate-binding protein YgfZ
LATASFSNPLVEQRGLLTGTSAVALDKSIITVSGEDRLTWLHALLSQNLRGLKPGESAEALLLNPQGHIEAIAHVVDDGHATSLLVDAESAEGLLDHLTKMKLRTKVELSLTNELQVFGTFGQPVPGATLVWHDPWPNVYPGGHRYAKTSGESWDYYESLAVSCDLEPAGTEALAALRIAAHRPGMEEVDDKTLPHELDLLATAVHLSKGCYRGQEAVAKVHNLGHPPRRLVLLHLDGSAHVLPKPGTQVRYGDQEVGRVTSVATHYEAGAIALAVVKRNLELSAPLELEGVSAAQEEIVPQDAGKTVTIDRKSLMGGRR